MAPSPSGVAEAHRVAVHAELKQEVRRHTRAFSVLSFSTDVVVAPGILRVAATKPAGRGKSANALNEILALTQTRIKAGLFRWERTADASDWDVLTILQSAHPAWEAALFCNTP